MSPTRPDLSLRGTGLRIAVPRALGKLLENTSWFEYGIIALNGLVESPKYIVNSRLHKLPEPLSMCYFCSRQAGAAESLHKTNNGTLN